MKTIQMTLEPELLEKVDKAAEARGMSRSAFTREALRAALARWQERGMEQKHREAYEKHPVKSGEFDVWEKEQVWVD